MNEWLQILTIFSDNPTLAATVASAIVVGAIQLFRRWGWIDDDTPHWARIATQVGGCVLIAVGNEAAQYVAGGPWVWGDVVNEVIRSIAGSILLYRGLVKPIAKRRANVGKPVISRSPGP